MDAANIGFPDYPIDARTHGTHTMGTITGLAPDDSIGVAPGSLWITANPIALGAGPVLDNAILASLEFMADPDGDPTTLDDVPAVVGNSWGVNESFAGYYDCDSRWWDAIDNCEAAGVLLVWAAGNEGPVPGTMRSPADRATNPYNCFSVGATIYSEPFDVADFSSRGPSGCGGAYAIKPEVCAPGKWIYSSIPDGEYDVYSGTSMATPHVAGVVALMNQANPDLDVTSIKQILMATATDLGEPGEDNNSGYGLIDAYAAVIRALEEAGSVLFTVVDSDTGLPQPGIRLTVDNTNFSILTDANGQAVIYLGQGEYSIHFEKFGYYPHTEIVTIEVGEELQITAMLDPLPTALVHGQVRGTSGSLVPEATVTFLGTPMEVVQVDEFGHYEVNVPLGTGYQMRAHGLNYAEIDKTLDIQSPQEVDFNLPQVTVEGFETGDFSLMDWQFAGDVDWWIDPDEAASGNYSASSGPGHYTDISDLIVTLEVIEGEVSFDLKVDLDPSYASLSFYIDGSWLHNWSGDTGWIHESFPVTAGTHTFKWRYGGQQNHGSSWIDNVVFPFAPVEPAPRIALDFSAIEVSLEAGETTSESLLIRNAGEVDLDFQFNGQDMDWLVLQPSSGTVAANDSLDVALNFSALGLESGTYTGDLIIGSNDPGNLETVVPVTLVVGGVSGVGDNVPMPLALTIAPNPFNPMTRLHFSLPRDSQVELVIYDLAGRKIRSLVSGQLAAGPHEILWKGVDDNDASLASGIYLARLRADGDQRIIKLTLTR